MTTPISSGEKRDLVLAPQQYAFLQDETRGQIKTYVGPMVINQTGQDRPVRYDHANKSYQRVSLETAVVQTPVASEGDYIILENPAIDSTHPDEGSVKTTPNLKIGSKVNIPGPTTFALWPSQNATVLNGHNLRSNEYLLVRIYNEDEAKNNWNRAIVKKTDADDTDESKNNFPKNLTIGKLLIIKGTDVSFYIPPTGVEVVPDKERYYVRNAVTLERLEYSILIDQNGNKRYEKGPQVVFPEPTEVFYTDKENNRKFRAIELNPLQGLHIKVIAAYEEDNTKYKEGDELFITGEECAIYFPRVEHSLIQYGNDNKKHFATAIPAGEGRYIMNRNTGDVKTENGPKMLLPDPRNEVTIRRVLSEKQVNLWYPGNTEAAYYNQQLRSLMVDSPSARSGFISDADYKRHGLIKTSANINVPEDNYAFCAEKAGEAVSDTFTRNVNYSPPRTITLDTKYDGVPTISIWTGYAVMVVSKTGNRRVEVGPKSILLNYDENLEVLELSTGKPKNTDKLEKTAYLRVKNNKVGDVIRVTTLDHVPVNIKLSFLVNFENDPNKWFDCENYVKFLCDHARSILKGKIQKIKIEDFYKNGVDYVRDIILGKSDNETKREGLIFEENGMIVKDVEILDISIDDKQIAELLQKSQFDVVSSNITLSQAEKNLEDTKRQEEINREKTNAQYQTQKYKLKLEEEKVLSELSLKLTKIQSELKSYEEIKKTELADQEIKKISHNAELEREKASANQEELIAKNKLNLKMEELQAETDSIVKKFSSAQEGFSEALLTLSNHETLQKVAEAMSVQTIIGGRSFSDVLSKLFQGSSLENIMEIVTKRKGDIPVRS